MPTSTAQDCFVRAVQLHQEGRLSDAEGLYRQALAAEPDFAEALQMLGVLLHQAGRNDEAVEVFRRMAGLCPDDADAHNNLGVALAAQWKLSEAAEAYRRAIELRPDYAEAHNNLGSVLRDLGRVEDAVPCYGHALSLRPDYFEAQQNLGLAFQDLGRLADAIAAFQQAVRLRPDDVKLLYNLGIAYNDAGDIDRALLCHRRALSIQPDSFDSLFGLGRALKDAGLIDQAIAAYRAALAIKPDARAGSSLLFTLHYQADVEPVRLLAEHRKWNDAYARPLASAIRPHDNDPAPDRRLRIGYVSSDLSDHPVGRCLLPVLRNRDRDQFEVYCYAGVPKPDDVTARIRQESDGWCEALALSDEQLAQRVRDDRIDVLVDLSVHTGGHRLLVFARKPAPVQITWLGQPGTTGLDAIDYRISDRYLDPPGENDANYTEKTVRLPDTFWCYAPLEADVAPSALPALANGFVTFGCLNNFWKLNDPMIDLWSRMMTQAPGSKLLLRAPSGTPRQRLLETFGARGIDAGRIEFAGRASRQDYWRLYHRIDLYLDTAPYGGHTTAMDSTWMGVPVVSLVGQLPVGRAGLTIASNLNLPELAAAHPAQYAGVAIELAQDLPRLAELRHNLRGRLQNSPLMDAPRFTRNLESAFRGMWHAWCRQRMMEGA